MSSDEGTKLALLRAVKRPSEEDAFFLMRLLDRLEDEADRERLVDIAEWLARFAQK